MWIIWLLLIVGACLLIISAIDDAYFYNTYASMLEAVLGGVLGICALICVMILSVICENKASCFAERSEQYTIYNETLDYYKQHNYELTDVDEVVNYFQLIDNIKTYNRQIRTAKEMSGNPFIGQFYNEYYLTLNEISLEGVKIYE